MYFNNYIEKNSEEKYCETGVTSSIGLTFMKLNNYSVMYIYVPALHVNILFIHMCSPIYKTLKYN